MAFTDNSDGRTILAGFLPVKITLSGTVRTGDPVGYSSGWKQADGDNSIYAELVAGQHGSSGKVITCYRIARVGGITTGTDGNILYLSDVAGEYSASAGAVSQRVGFELGGGEMLIEPKDIVLVRAEQVTLADMEDLGAAGNIIVGATTTLRPTSVAMSGDVTIAAGGATTIGNTKVVVAMLATNAVETTKIKALNVTIAKLEAAIVARTMSFGSILITETTVWKIYFKEKATITKITSVVTVALSANETTLTTKNSGGTGMTNGVITIVASASAGEVDTCVPSDNNVVTAGDFITVEYNAAPTTGEVILNIEYTLTA